MYFSAILQNPIRIVQIVLNIMHLNQSIPARFETKYLSLSNSNFKFIEDQMGPFSFFTFFTAS
jgi:hypothetical protein